MTAARFAERLGGARILKTAIRSELDLARAVHDGIPTAAVDAVLESGLLDAAELYALVIPRRTLTHRRERGQPLGRDESDRFVRAVRALVRAEEALGDAERAAHWMRASNRALRGERPIDLLSSDVGTRMIERVLGRIEHGVYG